MHDYDVIVAGGGIAGVSLASELARTLRVCVLESGPSLFGGSTGNSAATFVATYDNSVVRQCTVFSREVFQSPHAGWVAPPLQALPLMRVATHGEEDLLRDWHARVARDVPDAELLGPRQIQQLCPLIKPEFGTLALYEPGAMEIDVAAVCETYRRRLLQHGGVVATGFEITAVERAAGSVTVRDRHDRQVSGRCLVIAAGAGSDRVGRLAGAVDVRMTITRRTLFLLRTAFESRGPRVNVARAAPGKFYFRPEGAGLLCSPADETVVATRTPAPDEFEVARALDDIEAATTIGSRHVGKVWAATRSHVADQLPVIGFDPLAPDTFWFTGFFGYGIQANPGLLHVAARLFRHDRTGFGSSWDESVSPDRFAPEQGRPVRAATRHGERET